MRSLSLTRSFFRRISYYYLVANQANPSSIAGFHP